MAGEERLELSHTSAKGSILVLSWSKLDDMKSRHVVDGPKAPAAKTHVVNPAICAVFFVLDP